MLCPKRKKSFNDHRDKKAIHRTMMFSARKVAKSITQMGKGAILSNQDKKNAYKLVPSETKAQRLKGFKWMGA